MSQPDDPRKVKADFIAELKSWRKWYRKYASLYGMLWNGMTIAVIVLSALTSVLVAANFGSERDTVPYYILIALPALASLISTLLVQFRVRETWQLRATGLLDIEDIIVRARAIPDNDIRKLSAAKAALRREVLAIDRAQAAQFFAYLAQKPEHEKHPGTKPVEASPEPIHIKKPPIGDKPRPDTSAPGANTNHHAAAPGEKKPPGSPPLPGNGANLPGEPKNAGQNRP